MPEVPPAPPPSSTTVELETAEALVHTLFRSAFREGVRVPLRVNGVIDLEIVAKDNNVVLNTYQVSAELPVLSVWRITLAYRGRPVVEYGRGVKNNLKIHVPTMAYILLTGWVLRRRRSRLRAREQAKRDRALMRRPSREATAERSAEPPL
jgi:hypothetical protein